VRETVTLTLLRQRILLPHQVPEARKVPAF